MTYRYSYLTFPNQFKLSTTINLAAGRLHKKLIQVDFKQCGISEYNQSYLRSKLSNPIRELQLCSYLLSLSLFENKVPLDRFVFVDYGGGIGILALLAKELGINRVIYNDIYDVSCEDAKVLAREANIDIDDFVCGGIDELIHYVTRLHYSINAITSHDVIEHIYDIESYLRRLSSLSNNSFRVVFGSGANIKNPLIRWKLRKKHLVCEYEHQEKKWGYKDRDTLKSFHSARREIIKNYNSALSSELVEKIVKSTRGLMKGDIERCVDEYEKEGRISYKPDDPTNTCDPYTGNWAEHLMQTDCLKDILQSEGFEVKILNGYWPYSSLFYKRLVMNALNIGIKYLGKKASFFSPYYIIYADYCA